MANAGGGGIFKSLILLNHLGDGKLDELGITGEEALLNHLGDGKPHESRPFNLDVLLNHLGDGKQLNQC